MQILACGLAFYRLNLAFHRPAALVPNVLVCLPVLWVVLLAGQLVPLPPAVWQHLPGREPIAMLDRGMGWNIWRPLSLDPEATLDGLISLIPALLVWFLTAAGSQRSRMVALRAIMLIALASACLGLMQTAGGADASVYFWETAHHGFGVGFFVNRNHQAAFLLVGIALSGVKLVLPGEALLQRHSKRPTWLFAGAMVLLLAGVLATASRTGMALTPLALACACFLRFRARGRVLGLAVILALVLALAFLGAGLAGQSLARYAATGEDARWLYWQNTWLLMTTYLPYGSGFGSFTSIYNMVEPLDQVSPFYVPHAHSDWLEWVLEGGLPAAVLLIVGVAGFLWRAWNLAFHKRDVEGGREAGQGQGKRQDSLAVAGGGAVVLLALCSITDFPMRMTGLGSLFAFCGAVFMFAPGASEPGAPGGRLLFGVKAAALAGIALLSLSAGLSLVAIQAADGRTAALWAPWRGSAKTLLARDAMALEDRKLALELAEQALEMRPLDQEAVRIAGVASDMLGQARQAQPMLTMAGMLGWRDPTTQLWLIMKADALGARDYEIQRIDALLRQHVMQEQALGFLVQLALQPDGAAGVAERLRDQPGWRLGFLNKLGDQGASSPEALLRFFDVAQKRGARFTVAELNLPIWRLLDAGRADEARQLWRLAGGAGLIGDGRFSSLSGRLPEHAGAFQWRSLVSDETQVFVEVGIDGAHRLHIQSRGTEAVRPLTQTLLLTPGHYRLSADLAMSTAKKGPLPDFEIACHHRDGTSDATPVSMRWHEGSSLAQGRTEHAGEGFFDIPATCGTQELMIAIRVNDFQPFELAFTEVAIHASPLVFNTEAGPPID